MSAGENVVAHPTICREAISFYIVLVGKNCGMDGLNLDGEGGRFEDLFIYDFANTVSRDQRYLRRYVRDLELTCFIR